MAKIEDRELDESRFPFGKYYDGGPVEERETVPEIEPSDGPFYLLKIFDERVAGRGCGICKTRMMRWANADDAAARYRRWLDLVVEDVDAKLTPEDRTEFEYELDHMIGERSASQRVDAARQRLVELYLTEQVPLSMLSDAQDELESAQANLAAEIKARPKRKDSRRSLILKGVFWEVEQLDAGRWRACLLPSTYGLPMSYVGDWRGFTHYYKE